MPREMQTSAMNRQCVRAAEAIRRALKALEPGNSVAVDDVFAAFLEVHRVTELRLAGQAETASTWPGTKLNETLPEYRSALIEWERQLPRLHGWLLAERARLSSHRVHAGSVQAWIEMDSQTREPPPTK